MRACNVLGAYSSTGLAHSAAGFVSLDEILNTPTAALALCISCMPCFIGQCLLSVVMWVSCVSDFPSRLVALSSQFSVMASSSASRGAPANQRAAPMCRKNPAKDCTVRFCFMAQRTFRFHPPNACQARSRKFILVAELIRPQPCHAYYMLMAPWLKVMD